MEEITGNEENPDKSLYIPPDALARLDLETEQMMDSVQTFLMTPPSNKQTSGQSSSSDLLPPLLAHESIPSGDVEIEQGDPSSPFAPTGDLLNLQNETEVFMNSMKSSFLTPPPGFERPSATQNIKKSNLSSFMSPLALSDDLARMQDETEGMMDSIKSSLMTPQQRLNENVKSLQKENDSTRDDIDSSCVDTPKGNLPVNISFFSDDGINEEINTLDEAMPNLTEDLQKVNENEDNMISMEGILQVEEEVHEAIEEAGNMLLEEVNLTGLQSIKDNEDLDCSKDAKSIEERLSKEILLAKEELSKSEKLDGPKNDQDCTVGNMESGSETVNQQSQVDIHNLEVKVDENKSCSKILLKCETQKDSRMESNDEGLIYELAMIPVDLVNVIIESKIVRAAANSGAFTFVSSVVKCYPRELLVTIIAIYLYRAIKLACL